MSDGASEVRTLTPEEIDAIRDEITPINEIRYHPLKRLISNESPMEKKFLKHLNKSSRLRG